MRFPVPKVSPRTSSSVTRVSIAKAWDTTHLSRLSQSILQHPDNVTIHMSTHNYAYKALEVESIRSEPYSRLLHPTKHGTPAAQG